MAVDLVAVTTAVVEVDWGDDTFGHAVSDVSGRLRSCVFRWGAARRSNPQRPVIASGSGTLVLLGDDFVPGVSTVLSTRDLYARHRFRITEHTGADPISGWLSLVANPSRGRAAGRESTFRLEGLASDGLRTEVEFVQAVDGEPHDSTDFAELLEDAAGSAVSLQVRATSLAPFLFAGRRGGLLSQLALALGGLAVAGRSGGLSIVDPTDVPAGAKPLLSGAELAVLDASSELDVAQIRNSALVGVGMAAGDVETVETTVELTLTSTERRLGSVLTLTADAELVGTGADTEFFDVEVELTSLTATVAESANWAGSSASWAGTQQVNVDPDGAAPTVTLTGSTATVELVLPASWPPDTEVEITLDRFPFSEAVNVGAQPTFAINLPMGIPSTNVFWQTYTSPVTVSPVNAVNVATVAALVQQITARVQLTYGRRATEAIDQLVIRNEPSIDTWGERPIEFPAWIQRTDTTRIQAVIDALADSRRIHIIDLAVPQPEEAQTTLVTDIEPGDFVTAAITDPARQVNIGGTVNVFAVETLLRQTGQSVRRLSVIGLGGRAYSSGYSDGYG